MKSYISLISKYRAKLEIDFEKNQNKLFSNSVFDRKIQNDRKQRDVQLITNEKQKKRLASSGNFKGSKYVSDFPWIFWVRKYKVKVDRPYFSVN